MTGMNPEAPEFVPGTKHDMSFTEPVAAEVPIATLVPDFFAPNFAGFADSDTESEPESQKSRGDGQQWLALANRCARAISHVEVEGPWLSRDGDLSRPPRDPVFAVLDSMASCKASKFRAASKVSEVSTNPGDSSDSDVAAPPGLQSGSDSEGSSAVVSAMPPGLSIPPWRRPRLGAAQRSKTLPPGMRPPPGLELPPPPGLA